MNERRPTLTVILAEFLRARPNQWVDGRVLARTAGFSGWRARISECRKLGMTICNRKRRVRVGEHSVCVTEYRYEPPVVVQEDTRRDGTPHQPGLWS
jgi:hypothetical protein